MVRLLHLAAVLDPLAEGAVFVADAVAHHRQVEGGAGVEEAGRQAPQPAVAQGRVRLHFSHLLEGQADAGENLAHRPFEPQVEDRVAQRPAHQELHRQVVGPAAPALPAQPHRLLPARHQAVADGEHHRPVAVALVLRQILREGVAAVGGGEVVPEVLAEGLGVGSCAGALCGGWTRWMHRGGLSGSRVIGSLGGSGPSRTRNRTATGRTSLSDSLGRRRARERPPRARWHGSGNALPWRCQENRRRSTP